jgi:hypothetical protein
VDHVRSGPSGVHVVTAQGEFFTELTLKVLEERAGLVRCHYPLGDPGRDQAIARDGPVATANAVSAA